jgi:hypothetical protein
VPITVTFDVQNPTPQELNRIRVCFERQFNHDCVSVEHQFLALVKENFGLAARVLQNSNCSLLSGRHIVPCPDSYQLDRGGGLLP